MTRIKKLQAGQFLVELLIVIALFGILLPAFLVGIVSSREGRAQEEKRITATALLKEAEEAVRLVKQSGWNSIPVNGTYHPLITGSSWTFGSGGQTINGFTRQMVISDTFRDSSTSGKIVTTGGFLDPSTKTITNTVSWTLPHTSSITSTMYLTRYRNAVYIQTTQADFDAGSKTNVVVTNTSGGEVVLGAGGGGDWCNPNLSIASLDLPKNGVANALTAIEGKAFAGTGDNASGISFANIGISNTNPPLSSVSGAFDGYKTNGVFGESNYAYLATDTNSREIVIIDLTRVVTPTPAPPAVPKYVQAGYFDAPGNGSGRSVFVKGNVGYMTSGSKFYTFNLSAKLGSRPLLGSLTLVGPGNKIYVVGNYAYVAVQNDATQLTVINVANPSSPTIVKNFSVGFLSVGVDVFVNSSETYAYLVTNYQSSQPDFFILDIANKSNPIIKGVYNTSGMNPKGVAIVPGNRAIVVGSSAEQYQVLDISNVSSPVRCGGLTNPNGATSINAVSSVTESDGDAFSYILTNNQTKEFQIIEGGPGGQYAPSGVFISSIFDALASAAFNRFDTTTTLPSQTNISYQVASADAVGGFCGGATFAFVGPDGTSASFFTSGSAIPVSITGPFKNPARCFQYKVFLSTNDFTQTPLFHDITVSYSP